MEQTKLSPEDELLALEMNRRAKKVYLLLGLAECCDKEIEKCQCLESENSHKMKIL